MKNLIALSLVSASLWATAAWAAPTTTLTVTDDNARDIVGALLTAGIPQKSTSKAHVYTYTIENMMCKTTNHGGPEDFGISYLVGCFKNAKPQTDGGLQFGTGVKFHDAESLANLIQKAADANQAIFYDCGMGKCYASAYKIQCTVDVNQEASKGCSCAITLPNYQ